MDQPPEFGTIDFLIPLAPISLQAKPSRKRFAQANFKRHIPSTKFLLSGDVELEIEWVIHEAGRYESDAAPDIDNILKPLMDVLRGPDGIVIDDNQVQSLKCSWIDWTRNDEHLNIRIRFLADEFVYKDGLIFVEMGNSLCMPINKKLPPEGLRALLDAFKKQADMRRTLQDSGMDYYGAKSVMSVQRVFHRSRVFGFNVIEFGTLQEQVDRILRGGGGLSE